MENLRHSLHNTLPQRLPTRPSSSKNLTPNTKEQHQQHAQTFNLNQKNAYITPHTTMQKGTNSPETNEEYKLPCCKNIFQHQISITSA
jgi:hypothetical protein